jgi:hypothetical protein
MRRTSPNTLCLTYPKSLVKDRLIHKDEPKESKTTRQPIFARVILGRICVLLSTAIHTMTSNTEIHFWSHTPTHRKRPDITIKALIGEGLCIKWGPVFYFLSHLNSILPSHVSVYIHGFLNLRLRAP